MGSAATTLAVKVDSRSRRAIQVRMFVISEEFILSRSGNESVFLNEHFGEH